MVREWEQETGARIYLAAGPLAAVLLGMVLVPLRELTTVANLTFPFLALTILIAEFGGRRAAMAVAVASAASMNFFLTKPYLRLSIDSRDDIIAFAGLAACGLIAAACGPGRGRSAAASNDARRHNELLHRTLLRIEEAGPVENAMTAILDSTLATLPLAAAVVRDDRGEIVAFSGRAAELSAAGKILQSDTLLPLDATSSKLPRKGLPLPAAGGRIPLRESNRSVGSLDVWGTESSATAESRRTVADVGRVLSTLLARTVRPTGGFK